MWSHSLRSCAFYDKCQRPSLEILQEVAAGALYVVSVAARLNFTTMQACESRSRFVYEVDAAPPIGRRLQVGRPSVAGQRKAVGLRVRQSH
jgi:hypothetical protein